MHYMLVDKTDTLSVIVMVYAFAPAGIPEEGGCRAWMAAGTIGNSKAGINPSLEPMFRVSYPTWCRI